jgi:hypothetical protein
VILKRIAGSQACHEILLSDEGISAIQRSRTRGSVASVNRLRCRVTALAQPAAANAGAPIRSSSASSLLTSGESGSRSSSSRRQSH